MSDQTPKTIPKEKILSSDQVEAIKKELSANIEVIIKNEVKQTADENKVFELLRSELAYEANLIAHRTSWFVASQAFFFTSLAAALDRSPGIPFTLTNSVLFPLIPWVGLIVCIVILLSVLAAFASADRTRTKIKELVKTSPLATKFPQRNFLIILLGLLPSFLLPIVFAVCWIIILQK